jgi:hypothetical protein
MTEVATNADLAATKADLRATTADLKAAYELATLRLTVRLGGIVIAGFVVMGLLLCGAVPFWSLDSSCPGLSHGCPV